MWESDNFNLNPYNLSCNRLPNI